MIDVARLLAMLFIVVGHVNIRTPFYQGWSPLLSIASAMTPGGCVAFFFMFAGYFQRPTASWLNWRRGWAIFVPLLLWCIIGHFWFGAINQLWVSDKVDFVALINRKLLDVLGPWTSVGTPGSCDCWFLKVLIPLVLMSSIFIRMRNYILVVVILLSAVASAYMPKSGVFYVVTSSSMEGMSFYVAGILLRRHVDIGQLNQYAERVMYWVVPVILLLCVTNFLVYPVFRPGAIWVCVLGIVNLLCLSKLLCKLFPRFAMWFADFAPGVFFIYMVQEMLVMQCRWFYTLYPISKHAYALVPFGIFAVLMLGYRLVRRYMPWACGLLCLNPVKKKG